MIKELTRPSWYQDEFYERSRTIEEWLYEFSKRDKFQRDDIGLPYPFRKLPIAEQEKYFIEIILDQQIDNVLNLLEPISPQSIKYPSVSDIFRMYHLLINTDWYKNHPRRCAFEIAMSKITNNNGNLTDKQKDAFMEMHDTPWCAFHENHQQEGWYPSKEITHLSGIPISLDLNLIKDSSSTLKKKLSAWVGKPRSIEAQIETWQESKILAVFDLMHWYEIQGIKYKKIGLHELIWPSGRISKLTDELVEPNDDIKHSIRLVNEVINQSKIRSLFILSEHSKFENEMAAV